MERGNYQVLKQQNEKKKQFCIKNSYTDREVLIKWEIKKKINIINRNMYTRNEKKIHTRNLKIWEKNVWRRKYILPTQKQMRNFSSWILMLVWRIKHAVILLWKELS